MKKWGPVFWPCGDLNVFKILGGGVSNDFVALLLTGAIFCAADIFAVNEFPKSAKR